MPARTEHFQEGFKNANVPPVEELVSMANEFAGFSFWCIRREKNKHQYPSMDIGAANHSYVYKNLV